MVIKDLEQLLLKLRPRLKPQRFVFCSVEEIPVGITVLSTFVEEEGISLICEQSEADAYGLEYDLVMKMITMEVYSSLEAVGLTAVIAKALTDVGISANVVAAYHHDHVFVPENEAERAVKALSELMTSK